MRPTTINVAKKWRMQKQASLLSSPVVHSVDIEEQKRSKNDCFDLLDALTKSGGLAIEDNVMLHIVVISTHIIDDTVINTLVKKDMNPIDSCEQAEFLMSSVIHQKQMKEVKN